MAGYREEMAYRGLLQCTKCRCVKPLGDFSKRASGCWHSWCRQCKREYDRSHVCEARRRMRLDMAAR